MKAFAFVAPLILLCATLAAQTQTAPTTTAVTYLGNSNVPLIGDKHLPFNVAVWSRWNLRGKIAAASFRVEIVPIITPAQSKGIPEDALSSLRDTAVILTRGCSLSLRLQDSQLFPLAKVPLETIEKVDETQKAQLIEGNGTIPLSMADYKDFISAKHWDLAWIC